MVIRAGRGNVGESRDEAKRARWVRFAHSVERQRASPGVTQRALAAAGLCSLRAVAREDPALRRSSETGVWHASTLCPPICRVALRACAHRRAARRAGGANTWKDF